MLKDKRQLTDIVKFLAAILVVNGHLLAWHTPYHNAASFWSLGAQCVALFLFFSGYGLQTSLEMKGDAYLEGFFRKRMSRILIPFFTAYIVTVPVYFVTIGDVNPIELFETLYWGGPYLKVTWYVTEIAILYVLFWLSCKMTRRYQMQVQCLLIIVVGILFLVLKMPLWWLAGLPCFLLGGIYQKYESKIKLSNIWVIICSFILYAICNRWCYVTLFGKYQVYYITTMLYCIFFCMAVVGCILRIRTIGIHKRFTPLVNSFYEIYLMQNCCFIIIASICVPPYMVIPSTFILLLFVSVLMFRMNTNIFKRLAKWNCFQN